jgi:MFS family permease
MLLVSAGAFALAFFRSDLWVMLVELLVLGVGFGTTVSLSGSIVALAAPVGETGVATAITSVLRRAGGAVGAQVSVALLALIALPDGSPAPAAFTTAFVVAAVVGLLGAVCAALVAPRRPPPDRGDEVPEAE